MTIQAEKGIHFMDKQEFLRLLEDALRGEQTEAEIRGHIQYYNAYIEEEMRKGKTEEQVTSALGDPRLIARTILETSGHRGGAGGETYYEAHEETQRQKQVKQAAGRLTERGRHWLRVAAVIGVVLLILWFLAAVVSFLLPIVLPVAAVLFLLSYFRKR